MRTSAPTRREAVVLGHALGAGEPADARPAHALPGVSVAVVGARAHAVAAAPAAPGRDVAEAVAARRARAPHVLVPELSRSAKASDYVMVILMIDKYVMKMICPFESFNS